MKSKIYSLIAAAALAMGLCACGDDKWEPATDKQGTLSLASMSVDVSTAETLVSRAADVDLSGFIVTIKQGDDVRSQWAYAEMPEIVTLPVGDYTVDVCSHQVQKQDWDKPYYYGSKAFSITANEVTEVGDVLCKFASLKVTIVFAPQLLEHAGDDCKVTVIANDEGKLVFTPADMERAGYFEVVDQSVTLVATFEGTIDGSKRTVTKTYADVAAGSHFRITYSVGNLPAIPDELGGIDASGISVNTQVTDVNVGGSIAIDDDVIDPGERPDKEEPDTPDVPDTPDTPDTPDVPAVDMSITCPTLAFSPAENLLANFTEGKVTLHSAAGFQHVNVNISSNNSAFMTQLPMVGLPLEFDLVNPGELGATLGSDGFGFPTGSDFEGKQDALFDITDLVPLLKTFKNPSGDTKHSFHIEIVDLEGNSYSSALIFVIPE